DDWPQASTRPKRDVANAAGQPSGSPLVVSCPGLQGCRLDAASAPPIDHRTITAGWPRSSAVRSMSTASALDGGMISWRVDQRARPDSHDDVPCSHVQEALVNHVFAPALFVAILAAAPAAWAQNVKVTPLGSHAGELCARDRATIFEDPTGVRILYDPGQSVTGADDPRLGKIDVVILSHAHGDHIGDMKLKALGAGTCATPEVVSAAPQSSTGEIVAAKNAAIVMVGPLGNFIAGKAAASKSKPTGACAVSAGDIVGPLSEPCSAFVQTGGARTFKASASSKAVEIVPAPAMHESTVPVTLLGEASRKSLQPDSMSLTLG